MDTTKPDGVSAATEADRRSNPRLRSVFTEAYDLLEPFFDPAKSWGGHSLEHLAYYAVRDRFPELTKEDVMILVMAAQRVFSVGSRPIPQADGPCL